MTPDKTYTEISKTIDLFNNRFMENVASNQEAMWKVIFKTIKNLETNAAGNIIPNTKNLKILRTLRGDLSKVIVSPKYKSDLKEYLGGFNELKGINDVYYSAIASSTLNANKNIFKEIVNSSIEATKNSLLNSGIDANVIAPIEKILSQSVTTGGSFTDLVEALRLDILGSPDKLGYLERYTSQITTDSLNQFNANYNIAVSNDLGLEFYYYAGSEKTTSRAYCINQIDKGRYFHKKEVEASAIKDWAGKIPNTNSSTIFVYRGGYRCGHQYLATNTLLVPKDVIDRNIANGNYKPLND